MDNAPQINANKKRIEANLKKPRSLSSLGIVSDGFQQEFQIRKAIKEARQNKSNDSLEEIQQKAFVRPGVLECLARNDLEFRKEVEIYLQERDERLNNKVK